MKLWLASEMLAFQMEGFFFFIIIYFRTLLDFWIACGANKSLNEVKAHEYVFDM